MAARSLTRKEVPRRPERRAAQVKGPRSSPMSKNGNSEREACIKEFITNSLKLHDELMVNHEAIEAARREYVAEFQQKRQTNR